MKRLLIISIFTLLGMYQAVAQEYEYVPFVREGVKWVYSIWEEYLIENPDDPTRGDNWYYRTLELRGDTVINDKTYKAMHKCVADEMSEPSDVIPIYLREEDKRVYGIVPDGKFYDDAPIGDFRYGTQEYYNAIHSGQEFLLYDFTDPIAYWDSINNHNYTNVEPFQVDTIMVGNELGAGRLEQGKRYGIKLKNISWVIGLADMVLVLALTPLVTHMVKLTEEAHGYLTGMMIIMAVYMIGRCVNTVTINGVLDGGGDTVFDMYSLAACMWGVAVPLALLGAFVFHWHVFAVYACTCLDEVGKIPWVMYRLRQYKWVRNLTR